MKNKVKDFKFDFYFLEKFVFILALISAYLFGSLWYEYATLKRYSCLLKWGGTLIVGFVVGVFIFLLYSVIVYLRGKKKVHKPSDNEWLNLLKMNIYHLTSDDNYSSILKDNKINLNPTTSILANVGTFFKKSTYFFTEYPNKQDIENQGLKDKSDLIITIPVKNLDRNKVRLRKDKTQEILIYLGGYKGEGDIQKYNRYN